MPRTRGPAARIDIAPAGRDGPIQRVTVIAARRAPQRFSRRRVDGDEQRRPRRIPALSEDRSSVERETGDVARHAPTPNFGEFGDVARRNGFLFRIESRARRVERGLSPTRLAACRVDAGVYECPRIGIRGRRRERKRGEQRAEHQARTPSRPVSFEWRSVLARASWGDELMHRKTPDGREGTWCPASRRLGRDATRHARCAGWGATPINDSMRPPFLGSRKSHADAMTLASVCVLPTSPAAFFASSGRRTTAYSPAGSGVRNAIRARPRPSGVTSAARAIFLDRIDVNGAAGSGDRGDRGFRSRRSVDQLSFV